MTHRLGNWLKCLLIVGCSVLPTLATAGDGLDDPYRAKFMESLKGKRVAFLPVSMSIDLVQAWWSQLKTIMEPYGVQLILRDPNWNTSVGAESLAILLAEKPDLMIVHSPDVQTYARLLQQAEKAGILVIQVQMHSSFNSDAYVGPDWIGIGEEGAESVVQACKGKSNKIAIMQGNLSAAASAYQLKGVENVLAKHPEVKVVSSQAADWDAAKAKAITQTVLKQHPDLCGIVGFWDGMDIGTSAAVREAGLVGKVYLATSGGGRQQAACDLVKSGAFSVNLSYDAMQQGRDLAHMATWMLQSGLKAGQAHGTFYSPLTVITPETATQSGTCWKLGK
jgi:ABC-type sugar transport system substrate-binding protein